MGGNNRKKLNKSKSRGPGASSANRDLFVEGGLLSDWSPFNSPPSRGSKRNKSGNKNSRPGNGKGISSDSKPRSGSGMGSQSRQSRGNTIRYVYPQKTSSDVKSIFSKECPLVGGGENQEIILESSNPIVLIDSEKTPIVVYMDEGPVKESKNVEYVYDYTSSFTLDESSHRGLGFHDEAETTPNITGSSSKIDGEENGSTYMSTPEEGEMDGGVTFMDDDANDELTEGLLAESAARENTQGYVVIGGTRIYTEDISDEDDDDEGGEETSDDESSGSSVSDDETSECDDSSYSGSDIDDDIAADYFEGIGGIENVVNVDQLVGKRSDIEDGFHETIHKLGGIALQEASREYGLMYPGSGRKYRTKNKKSGNGNNAWLSSIDDMIFVKDPRTASGRKKHASRFPQSWPSEASKSKRFRRIPGEKKKHRKETIAVKRRDRMLRRGVDLQKINSKLQQIVLDGVDIFSFQSMDSRDCSQVRKLASIYRLRSGLQGSGRKRFVTVVRTQHTSMPSASDTIRLEKLIGPDENADFSVIDGKPVKMDTKYTSKGSKSSKEKSNKNSANKTKKSGKVGSYAAQPLSFVSSGILNAEIDEVKKIDTSEIKEKFNEIKSTANSVEYGSFEMHTTGFGSKMLAKMGYVEGSGLGKEGQGMSKPIEVFQRPKSLGLGANVPETSIKTPNIEPRVKSMRREAKSSGANEKSTRKEVPKMGSFERHTKGFGSKLMAKMGFVEGEGLGKDAQGMVTPLVAVRRPKARGLGATS